MIVSSKKFSSHSQDRKKALISSTERKYQESNSHFPHKKSGSINTFNAQSTLVINMIPGCTASGPLKSLATLS